MAAQNVQTMVNGNQLMLFDENGKSFAFATNHTLTINGETSDTSTKDHGIYSNAIVNRVSWEISSENVFPLDADGADSEFNDLFTYMTSRSAITVYFGFRDETASYLTAKDGDGLKQGFGTIDEDSWKKTGNGLLYKGTVIITALTLNAPNGETASYSATFQGVGSLTKVSA